MLTGEYVVLDGATALAIPTKYGQSLKVEPSSQPGVRWTSAYMDDEVWFDFQYSFQDLESPDVILHDVLADVLLDVLRFAKKLNGSFLDGSTNCKVTSTLNFSRDWGLGSSSTLINNIAQWADVDPYALLEKTFGGSGYDIAVAQKGHPLLYTLESGSRTVEEVKLDWGFTDQLFFVHLNRKQDSREGIERYRSSHKDKEGAIERITAISNALPQCASLSAFGDFIEEHEAIISEIIEMPTVQSQLFDDYPGSIKSLGAWGGDFILATGDVSDQDYFKNKGYETVVPFSTMIK